MVAIGSVLSMGIDLPESMRVLQRGNLPLNILEFWSEFITKRILKDILSFFFTPIFLFYIYVAYFRLSSFIFIVEMRPFFIVVFFTSSITSTLLSLQTILVLKPSSSQLMLPWDFVFFDFSDRIILVNHFVFAALFSSVLLSAVVDKGAGIAVDVFDALKF